MLVSGGQDLEMAQFHDFTQILGLKNQILGTDSDSDERDAL